MEKDIKRKSSSIYKGKRKAARYGTSSTVQHHYGPQSEQPDLSNEELETLCDEYYQREVVVSEEKGSEIEEATCGQADCNLWYYHRRIRHTASNFGKVAKRREKTPVANLVKSLLYSSKTAQSKPLRWGRTHEVDAQKEYETHLKSQPGCQHAAINNTGLVIDTDFPCLACSPDSLVKIPGSQEPLGIAEYKCLYSLAHANPPQTAVEAASDGGKKNFYCQSGPSGDIKHCQKCNTFSGHHLYSSQMLKQYVTNIITNTIRTLPSKVG